MEEPKIFPVLKIGLMVNGLWPGYSGYFGFIVIVVWMFVNITFAYVHLRTLFGNLEAVMNNLGVTITISATIIKLTAFRIEARNIKDVINEIMKDWRIVNAELKENTTNYEVMVKQINRANYYSKILLVANNALVVVYLISASLVYFLGTVESRIYILPTKFPRYCKQSPFYEAILFSQTICGFLSSNTHAIIEGFLTLLVLHAGTKVHMLREEIKRCAEICLSTDNKEITGKAMKGLINNHMNFINYVEKIKDIYIIVSFIHVFVFTLLHVIVGYVFVDVLEKGDRSIKLLIYAIFTIRALLATMIHCIAGEYLMNQSERIFDELYNCNWYEFHVEDVKAMAFMIMKTRKPVCLVAAKFSDLSVRFLMSVVKTSFSFLSLVRASR